jgi:non-heme chloroperoxidase
VKETIVMIHGMWGSPRIWDCFKLYFETVGYSCITPALRYHDMKPHSQPDANLGRTSLLDYFHDLENQIVLLDRRPVIMGHSMGGLLAQMLAAKGLAKSLVLLAPAPPAGLVLFNASSFRSLLSVVTKPGFWNKPVMTTFKEASFGVFNVCPDTLKKTSYDDFVYESGRASFEIVFWYFDRHRASAVDEKEVTCPILVIAGKEDHIIPGIATERIAEKYKSVSTYKEVEDHAHYLIGEPGWENIANIAREWMEST